MSYRQSPKTAAEGRHPMHRDLSPAMAVTLPWHAYMQQTLFMLRDVVGSDVI